jgi:hypothetical protein
MPAKCRWICPVPQGPVVDELSWELSDYDYYATGYADDAI